MSEISKLIEEINKFRDERDWRQFHNPKDLALSLTLEAAEVLEHFQWKSPEKIEKYVVEKKEELGEELADVFYWVLMLSDDLKIDIVEAFHKKMEQNARKYPIEKSRGSAKKYTEL